jgi:hypothetical protein
MDVVRVCGLATPHIPQDLEDMFDAAGIVDVDVGTPLVIALEK